jgi:hypothetical protein
VWKLQIECNLQHHDFEGVLTGQLKKPDPLAPEATNEQKKELFKRANGYAVTLISQQLMMSQSNLSLCSRKLKRCGTN